MNGYEKARERVFLKAMGVLVVLLILCLIGTTLMVWAIDWVTAVTPAWWW